MRQEHSDNPPGIFLKVPESSAVDGLAEVGGVLLDEPSLHPAEPLGKQWEDHVLGCAELQAKEPLFRVSLETPIGEEEDSYLGDFIEDRSALNVADAACSRLSKQDVGEVLHILTDREALVVRLRFELEDGRSRTLEQVGREIGVTRERVRQIEAKALRKLREPICSGKLGIY